MHIICLYTLHTKTALLNNPTTSYKLQSDSADSQSSFVFEEAFRSAALLDCDRQEVGGHIRHQDLLHVAERGPPRHFVQIVVEPRWGRPVQKIRLFHLRELGGATQTHFRVLLEVRGHQVAGAVLCPVSFHIRSVRMQATLWVELFVGALAGAAVCVVMMMVEVVMFMAVTMVLWMSVGQFDQPHVFATLELSQFVRAVTLLLLCSPLVVLREGRTAAAIVKPRLRLRASLLRYVDESFWNSLMKQSLLVLTGAQFWRSDAYALSTVDSTRWEDGGNDCSQALSGSGGSDRFWGRVGDAHPSDCFTPEVIGLGLHLSLSLKQKCLGLWSSLFGPVQLPFSLPLLKSGKQAGVQDIFLRFPSAVFGRPPLPFHKVLNATLPYPAFDDRLGSEYPLPDGRKLHVCPRATSR